MESAASDWPLDRQYLAYQLRLMYNRLSGRNKQYDLMRGAQNSQPSGPESIMVHVGNAMDQIAKLCRYEEDWCAMIKQHYPLTAEPPPVKLPAYSTDSHREYAKLWRVRHLRSWERGVAMPALLPELPETVCLSPNFPVFPFLFTQVRKVFRVYKGNSSKDGDGSGGISSMASSQNSFELTQEFWKHPNRGTSDRPTWSRPSRPSKQIGPCSCNGGTRFTNNDLILSFNSCCTTGFALSKTKGFFFWLSFSGGTRAGGRTAV